MPDHQAPSAREVVEMFANMPGLQLLFLGLSAVTWLIGGIIVAARHDRRVGKSASSGFKSFAFPFKDFNTREWISLLVLAIVSLTFLAIAISLNPE